MYWRIFETEQFTYENGDILYLYTDGYQDQIGGPKMKKFKSANLKGFLNYLSPLPLTEQKIQLETGFNDWKGDFPVVDDVCVIGVKL